MTSGATRSTMTMTAPATAAMPVKFLVLGVLARREDRFHLIIGIGVTDHQLALGRGYGIGVRRQVAGIGILVRIKLFPRSPQCGKNRLVGRSGIRENG